MARTSSVFALGCALVALPLAASAADRPATTNYYTPAKLVKRGTATSAAAGAGTVIVQVLVNKDGTFKVQRIISSTNPADNAAALEIAQSSTYRPATKGNKPQLSFYSFSLKFTTAGVAAAPEEAGELGQDERMLKAGNFSGARTALTTYLAAHPDDKRALVDVGVANFYLNEFSAAAASFDKAGSVPQNYQALAASAYYQASVTAINAKNYPTAVTFGKRAVAYAPGFNSYSSLGTAEYLSNDYSSAAADLEKARAFVSTEKPSAKAQVTSDSYLVATYLAQDATDKARQIASEIKQLDPTSLDGEISFEMYYGKKADVLRAASKYADAATMLEQGAADAPSRAALFWSQAALAALNGDKPDNARAKADSLKALAADPNSAMGNFAQGIALANEGKKADALIFLQKADELSKKGSNAALTAAIETRIKQLNGTK
ncbi:MAG: tetratricopeptide repeat protein [Candidatus Eremiobacteraeota bacterium]|nr:tetratricopeptide repeat protein [Candidatus Eremiobacteraeota bacterium]